MNIFCKKKNNISPFAEAGFALLYAVLVSSLFLAIGATIASATIKNLIFASSGRESQFAFYSADSGVECALYWDKIWGRFPTSTNPLIHPTNGIKCNNEVLSIGNDGIAPTESSAVTAFDIGENAPYSDGALCVHVQVLKTQNAQNPKISDTQIRADGYNTCDTNNARRLERSLQVNY